MDSSAASFRQAITPHLQAAPGFKSLEPAKGKVFADDPNDSVVLSDGDATVRVEPSALEAWQSKKASTLRMGQMINECAGWAHGFHTPMSLVYADGQFRYFKLDQGKH